jgi:hypothetical protein
VTDPLHQVLENYVLGIIVLGAILAIAALFVALHLRPLSKAEINALAGKRRDRRIADYYTFSPHQASPNPEFKKRMNAGGRFYKLDESMKEFPALAAALLKYKKHEWIIIAFERQTRVCGMWLNKGPNRATVSPTAAIEHLVGVACRDKCTSMFIFHNHPNSTPDQLSLRQPSKQDCESALAIGNLLNARGVNLVEFVCERGRPFEYFRSAASSFLPVQEFSFVLEQQNGYSRFKNLSLHWERIF